MEIGDFTASDNTGFQFHFDSPFRSKSTPIDVTVTSIFLCCLYLNLSAVSLQVVQSSSYFMTKREAQIFTICTNHGEILYILPKFH